MHITCISSAHAHSPLSQHISLKKHKFKDPSDHRTLYDCTGHLSMKLTLLAFAGQILYFPYRILRPNSFLEDFLGYDSPN